MGLTPNEVKIMVIGVSTILLRHREQLAISDNEIHPSLVIALNALFWQKYQHDKKIYME